MVKNEKIIDLTNESGLFRFLDNVNGFFELLTHATRIKNNLVKNNCTLDEYIAALKTLIQSQIKELE